MVDSAADAGQVVNCVSREANQTGRVCDAVEPTVDRPMTVSAGESALHRRREMDS